MKSTWLLLFAVLCLATIGIGFHVFGQSNATLSASSPQVAKGDSWTSVPDANRVKKADLGLEVQVLTPKKKEAGQTRADWKEGAWKKGSSAVAVTKGTGVRLRVAQSKGHQSIRWFRLAPDVSRYYKNANFPWEANAYKWTGFGKIDYHQVELTHLRDQWTVDPFAIPGPDQTKPASLPPAPHRRDDLGSFWFAAEVLDSAGKIHRSPGLEDNNQRGISPKVFRVTIRKDDSYLGYLTGYFNVPGIFGSVPYQCNQFIGVDCADVIATAYYEWKKKTNKKEFNVDMVVNGKWRRVKAFEIKDRGKPASAIRWNVDVKPGDFISVKYAGRKRYQHIGALYSDTDKDGKLGPADLILHAGPEALHLSKLSEGGFDGTVVIQRPE